VLLSHEKKFIFIKTAKTAGTSIEYALASQLGESAIVTPQTGEEFPDQRYARVTWCGPIKFLRHFKYFVSKGKLRGFLVDLIHDLLGRRGPVRSYYLANEYDHMTAAEIKALIGESKFNEYFKVTVSRHPYERAISLYFWRMYQRGVADPPQKISGFKEWLIDTPKSSLTTKRKVEIDGALAVDFVIRYEHLAEDLAIVCEKLGLEYSKVSAVMKANRFKSNQRPKGPSGQAKNLITPEIKEILDQDMEWEFKTFGYEKIL